MNASTDSSAGRVTRLVTAWTEGDGSVRDELRDLASGKLRGIARRRLARGSEGHSVPPGERAHEGHLRLADLARLEEILALEETLSPLEERESRTSRIVEAPAFSGLPPEETAGALRVSGATVTRERPAARTCPDRALETTP